MTLEEQLAAAQAREAELMADNARLREAIACGVKIIESYIINYGHSQVLVRLRNSHRELLSTTSEQSFARYHNEVLEKAAKVCDEYADDPVYCGNAIRAMKEPE